MGGQHYFSLPQFPDLHFGLVSSHFLKPHRDPLAPTASRTCHPLKKRRDAAAMWVKNRYATWIALVNGKMTKTCAP